MIKKSLFNKVLIKKDFKISLPLIILNMAMLIFLLPYKIGQILEDINIQIKSFNIDSYTVGSLKYTILGTEVFSVVMAVAITLIIFSREKNSKSLEMLVALPFSRGELYFNKLITIFTGVLIPNAVIYFFSYIMITKNPLVSAVIDMYFLKTAFIKMIVHELAVISYMIVMGMLFSSAVATAICGSLISLYPFAFFVLLEGFFNNDMWHFQEIALKYTPASFCFEIGGNIYLIILSIVMILMGYVLFLMEKMERIGEFLTFKPTEIVFIVCFLVSMTLFCGNLFKYSIGLFGEDNNLLNTAIGSVFGVVLGYYIPRSLIKRNNEA